jgi:hypothetical protein
MTWTEGNVWYRRTVEEVVATTRYPPPLQPAFGTVALSSVLWLREAARVQNVIRDQQSRRPENNGVGKHKMLPDTQKTRRFRRETPSWVNC